MKRICVMMSLCFIVMFHFNMEKVAAKTIYREVEVDFIMTEQEKDLWVPGGQNNLNNIHLEHIHLTSKDTVVGIAASVEHPYHWRFKLC